MVMNLAFATTFPNGKPGLEGKPTHFIEKIWSGLISEPTLKFNVGNYEEYVNKCQTKFGHDFGYNEMMIHPKIHTMRTDEKGRWKKGNLIHPVINNRQPDRFQFAPILNCSGTERISLIHRYARTIVMIEETFYCDSDDPKMIELANNDGFDSVDDFFAWFNEDWTGKIIHWTPFRYVQEAIEVKDEQIIQ